MGNFFGKNVSTPKNYLTPKNNLFTSAELAKRIVIVCIEGAIMGFVLWKISEFMDPTYQAKKEAKARLEELRKKLQLDSNISFNSYEVRMASQLVFPDDGTDLDEVGGYSDILKQITDNVIVPLRLLKLKINFPSAYYSSPKGILMYGPPGCGKTLIARAIAKEVDAFFINFDISTLNDMWYGETSKLTKALFTLSQKIQPCIIFIDEIDAVLRNRSSNDHEATTTMKTQFMALWDGFSQTNSAVLIIGATNRPQDVDPAILRRLPFKIHVPKPDIKSREEIIRALLRSEQIDPAFDYLEVAKNTESMSGSDLKECVRLACLHKYRDAFNSHKRSAGNLQDKINVIKLSHDDLINAAKIMGKSNELKAFEMVNCPITLD